MSFKFIAIIASKIFTFKVETLENAQSYPFSQIRSRKQFGATLLPAASAMSDALVVVTNANLHQYPL